MSALLIVIVSVLYAMCGLVCTRLVAGHIAYHWLQDSHNAWYNREHLRKSPSGDQWFGAWCVALLTGVVWPASLVYTMIPFKRFAVGAEAAVLAKQRAEQQAEYIKQLERELDLSE